MKRKDGKVAQETFDKAWQARKRKPETLIQVLIGGMNKRRGTAHPGADHRSMSRRMAGMMLMLQNMPLHTDHHITRYKEIDQREKEGCLFDLGLF